jgi:hypothetical protein
MYSYLKNEIKTLKNYSVVIYTNRKGENKRIKFDTNKIKLISKHHWYTQGGRNIYACTVINGKRISMHHLLSGVTPAKGKYCIDHINRDSLDNRLSNLRKTSYSVNTFNSKIRKDNTSDVSGVNLYPNGKWQARIGHNGTRHSLGYYINKKDAIKARKLAEKKHYE